MSVTLDLPEEGASRNVWGEQLNTSLTALKNGVEARVTTTGLDAAAAALVASNSAATKAAVDARVAAGITGKLDTSAADTTVASLVGTSSTTKAALDAAYVQFGGGIQATVRKLSDTVSDVRVLVLGDSTASVSYWPDYLWPAVQALYPHRTLRKAQWDNVSAYGSLTQVGPAGTGTTYIDWYQGAQGGTVYESLYATWAARIAAVQPDLVIINYGHNYGATAAGGGYASDAVMDAVFYSRTLRFIADVKKSLPRADVMIASQNPYLTAGARTGISSIRAQAMRTIASELGCAYGPILEAFVSTGDPASYLGVDLLHPNASGAALGADALLPQFRIGIAPPIPHLPSPWLTNGTNLLTNGSFADFASPPTLTGWTADKATLSKDTTNYETKGYAVKITAAAGSGVSQMYQLLPIRLVKGQVVTVAARLYLPSASNVASCARLGISGDGVTGMVSGGLSNARDRYVWEVVTARVPDTATFATVSIQGGVAGSTDTCSVDRVIAVVGSLPRDIV